MDNIPPRELLHRIANGDASAASDIYRLSLNENYANLLFVSLSYLNDDGRKKVLAVFSSAPIEFQNLLHKRAKKASRESKKNTIISVIFLLMVFLLGVQTIFHPTIMLGLTVLFCIVFCMAGLITNSHTAQRAKEIMASLETAGGAELADRILMDQKAQKEAESKRPWQKRPVFWISAAAVVLLLITFPIWNPQKIYFRGLIQNLGNEVSKGQAFATLSRQTGATAIGLLIDALQDKNPQIQARAKDVLIAIGKPATEPLIATSMGYSASRFGAHDTLIAMGEPAVQPLIAALDNKGNDAADLHPLEVILNNIGAPAVEPLMLAARQGNPQTQLRAVGILLCDTHIGSRDKCILGSNPPVEENLSRMTNLLTDLLNDADVSVRLKAVESLSKAPWMTVQNVPLTVNTLTGLLSDADAGVRSGAVQLLSNAQWMTDEYVPLMVNTLTGLLNDASASIRRTAVEMLAKTKWMTDQKVPLLITALKDGSTTVRYAAAEALRGTNDELAISSLAALLNDKDNGVRVRAAFSLAQSGKSGIQALVSVLGRSTIEIAVRDYPSIIETGDKTTIPVLIAALFSYDDSSMALTYLNCGELTLKGAAEVWARIHGYQLTYTSGLSPDSIWGRH